MVTGHILQAVISGLWDRPIFALPGVWRALGHQALDTVKNSQSYCSTVESR